jgi:type VI secretion system protein ImpK
MWAKKSLLIVFEGEVDGGEKFFLLIGRMAVHPHEYADVLEILLRIVCLGFEGRYSVMEDGPRHLEKIRKRLMTLLASCRKTVPLALSAPLRDRPGKRGLVLSDLPLWTGAMVGVLVLCSLFGWYHHTLSKRWEQTEVQLLGLTSLSIQKPLRLSTLLKREIDRGQVMVDENADDSHVVFMGDYMFHSGSATIRPEVTAILGRVADEIASVDGDVHVVGHTDSVPMQRTPDGNRMLSEARSANVGDILYMHGTARSRIHSEGRGDTQPLADNVSADGRALNRRVEIIVKRSEV